MSDELTARLRATFVQELEEQVRVLNDALLTLEQNAGAEETIRSLFRSAHTIKGAARVAGVPLVEHACHALESVFAAVREGRHTLSASDFSLLFAACDALERAGTLLREDEPLEQSPLTELLPHIESLAGSVGGAAGVTFSAISARAEAAPEATQPPAGTPATPPDARAAPGNAAELVRIPAERLDALLGAVGELLVASGRVVERSGPADPDARRLERATDDVAELVRGLRMRPFGSVCVGLPRAARDVAAAEGKQVELHITGEDVEADRKVMDALREPLLHLVRNAVDHGIEPPQVREENGKPRAGQVRVSAALSGGRLFVMVADDGAGLHEDAVRRALRELGRPEPRSSAELADALLAGGFSTRTRATAISGRGVGVDLARSALARIGGNLDVTWEPGRGTTFVLECPRTPSTFRAVLVRTGPYLFAIPTASVDRLRRVRTADLRTAEGHSVLPTGSGPIVIHSLAALLGPPLEARPLDDTATMVFVSAGSRRAGIIVDEVVDEDEIVVRPLPAEEGAVPHGVGAAVLPSGRVALVLGVGTLLAAGLRATAPAFVTRPQQRPRQRVLVADDSITTRTLEQSVLEAAGYEVVLAVDGMDAWQRLERDGADVVVADIEMPRMDGLALCRRIRSSPRFGRLPVVLVTARASEDDRARGLEAGADTYLVKSSVDRASLLDAVQQLIGAS